MSWGANKKKEEKKKGFNDLFKPSNEIEAISGLKMGVYGKAKSGKTHLSLTFPKPIYVIDTEDSVRLNKAQFSKKEQEGIFVSSVIQYADKKKHKVNVVESLYAIEDSIDVITDKIIENEEEGVKGTIVVDSGTDLWEWLKIWLEEEANIKKTAGGSIPRFEWGKANKKYTEFMYQLLRSSWNVCMTFRGMSAVSDKGEDMGYDVPKWQKNTDFFLDLITEIKNKGTHRELIFRGDRLGDVGGTVKNPTWDSIISHFNEKGIEVV